MNTKIVIHMHGGRDYVYEFQGSPPYEVHKAGTIFDRFERDKQIGDRIVLYPYHLRITDMTDATYLCEVESIDEL